MRLLSRLSALLFLLFYFTSKAQTDIRHDTRVDPVLKQVDAKYPGLTMFSRKADRDKYVNMAVLADSTRTLTWFTCHGQAFDVVRLPENVYSKIKSGDLNPFSYYKDYFFDLLSHVRVAAALFRQKGQAALKDTGSVYHRIYTYPPVQQTKSTLQKEVAMEKMMSDLCLRLSLFESRTPQQLYPSDSFQLRFQMAGKMIRQGDTTTYYNVNPLSSASRIVLSKHTPGKMFVYDRQGQLADSVPLKAAKYAALLNEKEDVFLLYRGWLELQSQQAIAGKEEVARLLNREYTMLYKPAYWGQHKRELEQTLQEVQEQVNAVGSKVMALIVPTPEETEHLLASVYQDRPAEITYARTVGFMYSIVYLRGDKRYELTDHRGNVMAVVSDRKKGIDENGDGSIEYYNADVVNAVDYLPFGSQMQGRTYSGEDKYRYGFNGKENDNEVKGEGNQQDYGMRIYDPRIGKFLSVDPLSPQYPHYTPYSFAGNMPVWAIDLDGAEPNLRHKGNGIYGVGLFDQFELGSIQRHDASLRIGKSGKQFQLQWLLNNNGQMVGYLASRVIPEGEYKSLYGGKGEGLQEAFFIAPNKFGEFASNSDKYYKISHNAEMYDKLWGEIDRDPVKSLFDPRYTLLGQVGGAAGKLSGQLLRTIPIISRIEMQVLTRALGILNSKEFQTLRDAHANGVAAEVKIGGTTVLYEPDFSYGEAMTLHQENGFLLGPRAFSAKGGVEHTVLWELTRLETQGTGSLGVDETRSNTNSAEATANKLLPLVKEQPQ